jgi:hypothetical protein
MICCNEEVTTTFCPKCGKRVSQSDGDGLLLFLTNARAMWDSNVRKYQALVDAKPDDALRCRHLETAKIHFQRWNTWAVWVEKMIANDVILDGQSLVQQNAGFISLEGLTNAGGTDA